MDEKYRGYTITFDPPPIPIRSMDWHWASENFDAEQESDGTWTSNGLAGHSASLEEAKADIDEQIAENSCIEHGDWLIWESADQLWRGELKANYHADIHEPFYEAASAEAVKAEILEAERMAR